MEHMRAAENIGIALANKLKASGADEIVKKAKKTIADEINMKQQEKDLAIKNATTGHSDVIVNTTSLQEVVATNGSNQLNSTKS